MLDVLAVFPLGNWPYISVEEAAEQYDVSKKTIYRWIKQGKLKARLFRMWRINLDVQKKFYAILPNQLRLIHSLPKGEAKEHEEPLLIAFIGKTCLGYP